MTAKGNPFFLQSFNLLPIVCDFLSSNKMSSLRWGNERQTSSYKSSANPRTSSLLPSWDKYCNDNNSSLLFFIWWFYYFFYDSIAIQPRTIKYQAAAPYFYLVILVNCYEFYCSIDCQGMIPQNPFKKNKNALLLQLLPPFLPHLFMVIDLRKNINVYRRKLRKMAGFTSSCCYYTLISHSPPPPKKMCDSPSSSIDITAERGKLVSFHP